MPELPEVETIVRELAPRLIGRHILAVEILQPRITRHSRVDLASVLPGRPIKAVLLNQKIFSGVGNIYADEALFRARIRPTARSLSRARAQALLQAVDEVLREAIEKRGSSVSDYVDTEGRSGTFQQSHRVYQ